MTTATVVSCDSAKGCANTRPDRVADRDGWSHIQINTSDTGGGERLDVDLCPAHAIEARAMFGAPR